MVSLPFLIALFTLINATAKQDFAYYIDSESCKLEGILCIVRETCVEDLTTGDRTKLITLKANQKLKDNTCDVFVQMKPLVKFRFHFMMQVNVSASDSPSDELDTRVGVSIVQKETQIKCDPSGISGRNQIKIEALGNRQVNSKKLIFCSAIIANPDITRSVSELFEGTVYFREYPKLQYSITSNPNAIVKYEFSGVKFWSATGTYFCNDLNVNTENGTDNSLFLYEVNKVSNKVTCPIKQKLRIVVESRAIWPKMMLCLSARWNYMDDQDRTEEIVEVQPFFAHCTLEIAKTCTRLGFNNCPGCSEPSFVDMESTVTCPSNKWRLSDGSMAETHVKCKQKGTTTDAGWFVEVGGAEITEGGCSSEFYCLTYAKLKIEDVKPGTDDRKPDLSPFDKEISCPMGFQLIISKDGKTRNATKIACSTTGGQFQVEGTTDFVEKESSVVCRKIPKHVLPPKDPETIEKEAAAAQAAKRAVGYAFGGIAAVALLSGLVFLAWKRFRHWQHVRAMHPDGLYTCREVNTNKEYVNREGGKWRVRRYDWKQQREHDEKMRLKEPPPTAYHETDVITKWTAEAVIADNEFDYWKAGTFYNNLMPKFCRFSRDNRLKFLRILTAFQHYSTRKPKREIHQFGSIDQFFHLMKRCHDRKLKCYETWDSIFRLLKVFAGKLPQAETIHPIPTMLRDVVRRICNGMIGDIGYYRKETDSENIIGLRLMATRYLLWARDTRCLEICRTEAARPFDEVESPIRMVVWSYAVNNIPGYSDKLMAEFIRARRNLQREQVAGVKFGTYMQHIIYALASCKDTSNGMVLTTPFPVLRETFDILYTYKGSKFSPSDIYYAFRGATENWDSVVTAFDQFLTYNPSVPIDNNALHEDRIKDVKAWFWMAVASNSYTDAERDVITKRFKTDIIATLTILAENCTTPQQFEVLKESWWYQTNLAVSCDAIFFSETFNEELLFERTRNLNHLFTKRSLNYLIAKFLTMDGYYSFKDEYAVPDPEPETCIPLSEKTPESDNPAAAAPDPADDKPKPENSKPRSGESQPKPGNAKPEDAKPLPEDATPKSGGTKPESENPTTLKI